MTTVINFYGGPGSGKSTTAAGLFYLMKSNGIKVELVTEYAKDLEYEGRLSYHPDIQREITSEQIRRMARVRGKVDYIVTDAPLYMQYVYINRIPGFDRTHPLLMEDLSIVNETFDNIHIFLNRTKVYHTYGRSQSIEEAIKLDGEIKDILKLFDVGYTMINGNIDAPHVLMDYLFQED